MLKIFCVALVSSLLIGCSNFVATEEKTIQKIQKSTVEIVDNDKDTKCAGVWISEKYIVTAAHCVTSEEDENMSIDTVYFKDYEESISNNIVHKAKVYAIDDKNDVSILMNNHLTHLWVNITNHFYDGEKVWILGHPSGYTYSLSAGIVSGLKIMNSPKNQHVKVIQVSGSAWFGSSGGGVFNANGDLLGVCSFVSSKAPMINFFAPTEVISPLLEGL